VGEAFGANRVRLANNVVQMTGATLDTRGERESKSATLTRYKTPISPSPNPERFSSHKRRKRTITKQKP